MKILVDMNLSPDWVKVFDRHGIASVHWSAVGDPRAEDTELMDWARANRYAVFTSWRLCCHAYPGLLAHGSVWRRSRSSGITMSRLFSS